MGQTSVWRECMLNIIKTSGGGGLLPGGLRPWLPLVAGLHTTFLSSLFEIQCYCYSSHRIVAYVT